MNNADPYSFDIRSKIKSRSKSLEYSNSNFKKDQTEKSGPRSREQVFGNFRIHFVFFVFFVVKIRIAV